MKSRKYSTLLTAIIVTGFLTSCSNTTVDKSTQLEKLKTEQAALAKQIAKLQKEVALENPTKVNTKSKEVGVQELAPRKFDHYIQTQGKVESENNISVTAQTPGVVLRLRAPLRGLSAEGEAPVRLSRPAGADR